MKVVVYILQISFKYYYYSGIICLTLMLLLANLANTKYCKKMEKLLKPWHMGIHLSTQR